MGASILYAAAVIGIVGILAGILLGVASEKFKVKVDEKEIKVREALPVGRSTVSDMSHM